MAASRSPKVVKVAAAATCIVDANTTFVQADPATFRALVQQLTGATPTEGGRTAETTDTPARRLRLRPARVAVLEPAAALPAAPRRRERCHPAEHLLLQLLPPSLLKLKERHRLPPVVALQGPAAPAEATETLLVHLVRALLTTQPSGRGRRERSRLRWDLGEQAKGIVAESGGAASSTTGTPRGAAHLTAIASASLHPCPGARPGTTRPSVRRPTAAAVSRTAAPYNWVLDERRPVSIDESQVNDAAYLDAATLLIAARERLG